MRLKKVNAVLGLLSILFMLLHMGYSAFAYLTFYYNPTLKLLTAIPFMVLACLHAVCGMLTLSLQEDGGRMDLYPRLNIQTVLQRVSAALIFPLLILHLNIYSLMQACAERGQTALIYLLIAAELIFFAVVVTHVVLSLSRGLITLGILSSRQRQLTLDRVVYVIGALVFLIAAYAVVRGQVIMFLAG